MQKRAITRQQADNFIKFLGTAGARFVMIRQLRSSAGLWIKGGGVNLLVDPGPGCLVKCNSSRPRLELNKLEAIILTHCHLDHSNDLNVMIEAMTEGGFKKRGAVFLPTDCLKQESILLPYAKNFPERIETLKEFTKYHVGNFDFEVGPRNLHPVETYGLKFKINNTIVSLIGDTAFYPNLLKFYSADVLIINVVFFEPRADIEHLSFEDAKHLIKELQPKKAVLTHFGMTMLKAKPHQLAADLSKELKIDIVAAYDGMTLNF